MPLYVNDSITSDYSITSRTKTKILFLMMYIQMGGAEKLVYNLIRNIDRTSIEPFIAWFDGEDICEEFKALNVPLIRIPKEKKFDFNTVKKIRATVKNYQIDIIHTHSFMQTVYAYLGTIFSKKVHLVFTVHSEWEINQLPCRWKTIGKYLFKKVFVIGVSNRITNNARRLFQLDTDRSITIHNGVESSKGQTKDIRKELKLKENDFLVGMVANLKLIKNHKFLFKAAAELIYEGSPQLKILVVGQGFPDDPENTEIVLRNFVRKEKLDQNIFLLGYRSDVDKILPSLDAFCLTSFREGLPISLIEAMACGLPVIGSDVMGIKEVIKHGVNGYLVALGDIKSLKRYLKRLMADVGLRQKLGIRSMQIAEECYSLKNCVNAYQDIYFAHKTSTKPHQHLYT